MSEARTIRPATPEDTSVILRFIRELAEYEREPDAVEATEPMLREALFPAASSGRGPYAECVVAELDGAAVGMALFFHNFSTWTGRAGVYLEDLYVTPEARGRGVGRALLRRLAQIAVGRGCARLEWSVLDWNEPALGFYRAISAVPMTEWTVHRLDGGALRAMAEGG